MSLLGDGTPAGHRVLSPGFDRKFIVSKQAPLLDKLRAKYGKDRVPTTMTADDDLESADDAADAAVGGALAAALAECEGLIVQVAEAGVRRRESAASRFGELRGFFAAAVWPSWPTASTIPEARPATCWRPAT